MPCSFLIAIGPGIDLGATALEPRGTTALLPADDLEETYENFSVIQLTIGLY